MHVSAILLAAGKGVRFRSRTLKPLVKINSKPVIIYSLRALDRHPDIKDIIIVVNHKNSQGIINEIKQLNTSKVCRIIRGGLRRQDSVYNGLKAISPDADLVLIHDVARPFIDKKMISGVIKQAARTGAAIVGVPVKATIKEVRSSSLDSARDKKFIVRSRALVKKTLNRNNLWEIQTPQVFDKALLLKAYKKFGNADVTDDAALVEKMGHKVSVVLGSYNNIKITTPEDLVIAKAIARLVRSSE